MVDKLTIPEYSYEDAQVIQSMQWSMDVSRIAIVGPSGCGKTTLLHLLAGLLSDVPSPLIPTNSISMMFQEPRLMPWLTVAQNLQLVKPNLTEVDIMNILDSIGLRKSQHHYPKQLSGGMQRRVALARAFCIQPDVLLLDEPFISLDAPTANECRNLLQRLQQAYGTQFILVTHDLHEAIDLADKVIFLSKRPAKEILTLNVIDERRLKKTTQNIVDQLLIRYPNLLSGELGK